MTHKFMPPCQPTATTTLYTRLFFQNCMVPNPQKSVLSLPNIRGHFLQSSPSTWRVQPSHSLTKLRFLESLWIHASPWARMSSRAYTTYVPSDRYVHLQSIPWQLPLLPTPFSVVAHKNAFFVFNEFRTRSQKWLYNSAPPLLPL